MNSILSIPTIMICTAITTLIVAAALTYVWLFENNREKATRWWCMSMWAATFATGILSTRTVAPAWFSIGLGNLGVSLAFGLVSVGFAEFAGRRTPSWLPFLGAVIWVLGYYGIEGIRAEINNRIILSSIVWATYGVLIVRYAWLGWQQERLPSFMATLVMYSLHALAYAMRVPAALIFPASESGGQVHAVWFGVMAIEGYALTIFSTFIFIALIKERAERRYRLAAEIDALTSVCSRRFFVSETRAALDRQPDSAFLAVLDLDFFKKINDTYGHMAGDKVLQSFAYHVSSRLRDGMRLGRLGGEEFGLFIPDCSKPDAVAFLEDLRASVEALEIRFNGNVLKVTTSVGAASIDEAGFDFDHLMAGADNALYLAKEQGRNCVCFFSLPMRLHRIVEGGHDTRVSLAKKRVSRVSVRSRPGRN